MRDRIRWSVCIMALAVGSVRCGSAFTLSDEPDGSTGGYGGDTGIDATSPGEDAPGGHPIDASGPGEGGLDGSHEGGGGMQDGGSLDASDGGVGTGDASDGGTHPDASDAGRQDAAEDGSGTCQLCGGSCCDAGDVCCSSTGVLISVDGGGGSTGGTCQASCGVVPL